jgi:protein kinase A
LLTKDIRNRIGNLKGGCDDIKHHPWFANLDWDAYTHHKMRAPWVPQVRSPTDTSQFDPYDVREQVDNGPIDRSGWDRDF